MSLLQMLLLMLTRISSSRRFYRIFDDLKRSFVLIVVVGYLEKTLDLGIGGRPDRMKRKRLIGARRRRVLISVNVIFDDGVYFRRRYRG